MAKRADLTDFLGVDDVIDAANDDMLAFLAARYDHEPALNNCS